MSRHREARRSRLLVAAATVALVIAAAGALAGPGPTSSAQAAAPFTVTVSQSQDLADGQLVDVAVGMRPDLVAVDATAYVCRPGQTYTAAAHIGQNAGNCPVAVPLSGAGGETSNWRLHLFTGGGRARGDVAIGVGTAEWDSTVTTDRFSLTCGPTSPCVLVVRVQARPAAGGSIQQLFDASTTLTYRETDPLATCGGVAEGALRTAGAERMLDAWREWTLGHCRAHPGGSATMAPLPEEGAALADFTEGERDVVYTAAGAGEPGFSPATSRATAPTPVAVNAVVLAAAGGHFVGDDPEWPPTLRRPYDGLRLTPEEIAVMLGQGQHHLALTRGAEVLARNPQLGALHPTINSKPPFALSGATATSLYMTRYLDRVAGNAWTAGPEFGLAPRGVTANLGVPESPDETTFANALSIVSDPSLIARATTTRLLEISPTNVGPYWVWTDLATATRLGMTPVSLQNADGDWVAPTPESLAAAVPTMTRQPNGMLVPDVDTTAPGAYPLTIVEYALAPTELLADEDCTARSESQALLTSWLTYITGDGQDDLPAGFLPLTPALHEEAQAAILRVGSEAPEGCAVVPPTTPPTTGPTTTTTTTPSPASPDDGFDDGSGGAGSRSGDDDESGSSSPHGGTEPRESTPEDREEALEAVDDADVATAPPFAGIAALNELLSPLSLLLIVAMTSGAAFLTSGREPPPVLRASGRAVVGGVGATRRWLASPSLPGVGRPAFARRPR